MSDGFEVRGVVEGFYGPPWSEEARLDTVAWMGGVGMNAYVYAPKDDPRHRARWREPYDDHERDHFAALAATGRAAGVRIGWAISPGLDIDYSSPDDRDALLAKLRGVVEIGIDWIVLALDDIPMRPGLAEQQVALVAAARDTFGDGIAFTFVPTEYVGTRPTRYLAAIGSGLPGGVDVMWTGPTVCSPTISAEQARAWVDAVGGRPTLVWDNYPVNDATMTASLHLGPYAGREPGLAAVVRGVLCNPMNQAHASRIALGTVAAYLTDPDGYDRSLAWEASVAGVGGERATSLRALAEACSDSALLDADALPIHSFIDDLEADLDSPGWSGAVERLREALEQTRRTERDFGADGDVLAIEIAPWCVQARAEADAGLAALRLVQQLRPVAQIGADGMGRAAAPDADAAMLHVFGLLFAWSGARQGDRVVFGPRFGVYPAVVQLPDGRPAVDVDLAVTEDANAIDRLCRLALAAYRDWSGLPAAPLRVMADGEDVALGPDGTFAVPGVPIVVLRSGTWITRVRPGEPAPPFPDMRL